MDLIRIHLDPELDGVDLRRQPILVLDKVKTFY